MPLSDRDAFKRAFIKHCAEEGLSETQVLDRIAQALDTVEKRGVDAASIVNSVHEMLQKPVEKDQASPWPVALAAGTLGPAAVGAGLGALGSKLKGNWLDEEDVHHDELTEELRRQTALARQYRRLGGTAPTG